MITADQIIIHAIGDYILQSDWMASEKTKRWWPALCHAFVYSLGFLVLGVTWRAWLVIFGTHYSIDRYRLARYVVWGKNCLAPRQVWFRPYNRIGQGEWRCESPFSAMKSMKTPPPGDYVYWESGYRRTLPFSKCSGTGYPPSRPAWLSVWLLIAADNIIHVLINGAALRWL